MKKTTVRTHKNSARKSHIGPYRSRTHANENLLPQDLFLDALEAETPHRPDGNEDPENIFDTLFSDAEDTDDEDDFWNEEDLFRDAENTDVDQDTAETVDSILNDLFRDETEEKDGDADSEFSSMEELFDSLDCNWNITSDRSDVLDFWCARVDAELDQLIEVLLRHKLRQMMSVHSET